VAGLVIKKRAIFIFRSFLKKEFDFCALNGIYLKLIIIDKN